jgi:hypothetical protein
MQLDNAKMLKFAPLKPDTRLRDMGLRDNVPRLASRSPAVKKIYENQTSKR